MISVAAAANKSHIITTQANRLGEAHRRFGLFVRLILRIYFYEKCNPDFFFPPAGCDVFFSSQSWSTVSDLIKPSFLWQCLLLPAKINVVFLLLLHPLLTVVACFCLKLEKYNILCKTLGRNTMLRSQSLHLVHKIGQAYSCSVDLL